MRFVPEFINPEQFIISRKRKKYRFAKFNNSPLCFELNEWQKCSVDCIEVGAGNGMFMVEQAAMAPTKVFVAVDVKGDRLQKGASEAEARGLKNVYFVRARADQLPQLVKQHTVSTIWLTFSDPYPKKGSTGRRLTHPYFLALYRQVCKKTGSLFIKHDNKVFFEWSLEQLVATGWHVRELSFDLHSSALDTSYKVLTQYEMRWLEEGLTTNFVRATLR